MSLHGVFNCFWERGQLSRWSHPLLCRRLSQTSVILVNVWLTPCSSGPGLAEKANTKSPSGLIFLFPSYNPWLFLMSILFLFWRVFQATNVWNDLFCHCSVALISIWRLKHVGNESFQSVSEEMTHKSSSSAKSILCVRSFLIELHIYLQIMEMTLLDTRKCKNIIRSIAVIIWRKGGNASSSQAELYFEHGHD